MVRLPAVILAALLLVVAVPAQADAKPAPDTRTITVQYDANLPAVWPRTAPDAWQKGTGISFRYGPCSGALCIQVHTDEGGTPCSPEYGGNCAGQWEAGVPDLKVNTCHVWLSNTTASLEGSRYVSRNLWAAVFRHEVGHCLGHWWHSEDPLSLMYWQLSSQDPVYRPTRTDLRTVAALW